MFSLSKPDCEDGYYGHRVGDFARVTFTKLPRPWALSSQPGVLLPYIVPFEFTTVSREVNRPRTRKNRQGNNQVDAHVRILYTDDCRDRAIFLPLGTVL